MGAGERQSSSQKHQTLNGQEIKGKITKSHQKERG